MLYFFRLIRAPRLSVPASLMRPSPAVLQTPSKSLVPPRLLFYKSRSPLTHSESTLLQLLIPLHFNSPRINTYKKPGEGDLLPTPKFCNSLLPAPHHTDAKQHPPVSFTSFTSFASPSVTPFPATLTSHLQLAENTTILSPAFATLARRAKHKSFVCHSYRKHRGWRRVVRRSLPLFTTHYSLLTVLPQNFYPPASDLRHNPAAQGHQPQSSSRTGRIQ
jgi:hypothetical protein